MRPSGQSFCPQIWALFLTQRCTKQAGGHWENQVLSMCAPEGTRERAWAYIVGKWEKWVLSPCRKLASFSLYNRTVSKVEAQCLCVYIGGGDGNSAWHSVRCPGVLPHPPGCLPTVLKSLAAGVGWEAQTINVCTEESFEMVLSLFMPYGKGLKYSS